MISTFSQMNHIVINTVDMDALVEVLLIFHDEDMHSWSHRNFVFYKQTNEQYDTNERAAAAGSSSSMQVHFQTSVIPLAAPMTMLSLLVAKYHIF